MDSGLRVYDDVTGLLPSAENPTPLVRLRRTNPAPEAIDLFAKLEWANPFGSVKDRTAAALLAALEASGKLEPGGARGVVEPTSGNTGLSLALLAAARGWRMLAVVPERVPEEKKLLLRIAGALLEVVPDALCPAPGAGEGSIELAKTFARAQSERWAMPNQYENEANARAHYETTGPEIWRQTEGRVTHVFTTLGTCGTATGIARFLKEKKPGVRIVAAVPDAGHDVPGLRDAGQLGVSKLFDPSLVDELVEVEHALAWSTALELARREGLRAGPSSGLVLAAARRVVERDRAALAGAVGVAIFPDDSFKYTHQFLQHEPALAEGLEPGNGGRR